MNKPIVLRAPGMFTGFVFAVLAVLFFPEIVVAQANLTPYQPAAWSDKIVVSKVTGTNTDSSGLTTADTLYVDWAVINNGTAATAATFYTYLYVDGALRTSWYTNPPLNPNYYISPVDYSIGTLSAGSHTISILTDATGVIAESNESDNQYTKTILVTTAGSPNLTPYQPAGWPDKIVVSKVTGTNTDDTGLTTADTLYVDWAVINNGTAATAATFYTALYVDGAILASWYADPPLNPNYYISPVDYSIGTLSAGSHTISIVADWTGRIAESNESDNQYTKTITIVNASTPVIKTIKTVPTQPIKSQQFTFTIDGSGFDASTVEVFFLGPGCGTDTACVVPNNVLTTKTAAEVAGPATLTDGSFTVQVRNTSTGSVSNTLPLAVATQAGAAPPKVLVLLVDFPDKPGQTPRDYFQAMMFGNHPTVAPQGSFRDYYHEVSYGTYDVDGSVSNATIAWIRLPQNSTYYADNCYGYPYDPSNTPPPCSAVYPQNAQKMVEDAVVAARNLGLDFAPFDTDNDGLVDALFVIHAGQGGESTANRNNIWSHAWATTSPVNTGSTNSAGQTIYVSRYTTEPEFLNAPSDMTIGVFAHEYGHTRWELPDLYDTDYTSSGIGNWSLMAGGSWNGSPQGASPAHLDAWSKYFVGFISPTKVTSTLANESIAQAESAADVYQVLDGSAQTPRTGEYFLIENRQRTGSDSGLPGSGLLVWHIDESQWGNTNENYPGCVTCSGHYQVQLVQADNLWQLEKGPYYGGDAGDPFPGVCGTGTCNTSFTGTTSPNSHLWNGQSSGVTITNISASGSTMTATLSPTPSTAPSLSISKTHSGDFTQGQQNAHYTVVVSNRANATATSGTVTVTETAPSGLTLVSMSGTGWTCTGNTCTRSDALGGGSSYPNITVTVNALANATSPQVNAVAVSGGGSANANTTDSTTIIASDFSITATPSSQTVTAGNPTTYTLNTATTIGSAQTVNLSVSGLPSGATGSFNPPSVTSGGSSTLTVTTTSSTPAGSYTLTITGAGSVTHNTTVTLVVLKKRRGQLISE
jgi:immune inhibitor A